MKKIIVSLTALAAVSSTQASAFDLAKLVGAGADIAKAAILTDDDAKSLAAESRKWMDENNPVAPATSPYAKRLAKITRDLREEDGLKLDFKAYQVEEINAFAMADGTVRVMTGLMDKMTDDELRFVIGHEIGHVKLGHSKKAMQTAYAASGARKAAAGSGNGIAVQLSASEVGAFTEALVNAQFSKSQERDADDYGIAFMKRRGYDPRAGVTSLRKLEKEYGNGSGILASHPGAGDRAAALEKGLH